MRLRADRSYDLQPRRAPERRGRAGRVAAASRTKSSIWTSTPDIAGARRRRERDGDRRRSARRTARRAAPRRRARPGNSMRCCMSTGLVEPRRDAREIVAVAEWHVAHLPSPLKYAAPAVAIAGEDVLLGEDARDPRSVSFDAAGEGSASDPRSARRSELDARRAALHRMSLLQERPELAAVAIAQKHERAEQVRPGVGAARLRAVAGDALGWPRLLPASAAAGSTTGRSAGPTPARGIAGRGACAAGPAPGA